MSRIWLINHYASTPATGIGGRHHYFARELARLGHEVTLVAARRHHLMRADIDTSALPADEMVDGYRFVRIDVPRYAHAHDKRRLLAWFAFAARLPGLRGRLKSAPDTVLYSSPHPVGYLGAERLARACGARLVIDIRDMWPWTLTAMGGYSTSNPFILLLQWIEDRFYRNSDFVVGNQPGVRQHMESRGVSSEKFIWLPNGVNLSDVANPAPLDSEYARKIDTNEFNVVYAGTLGAANAMWVIIDAAKILIKNSSIRILIAGSGRDLPNLKSEVLNNKLENVVFLGVIPKNQIFSLYNVSDALFLSWNKSDLYKWGMSTNKAPEYLAASRPIIQSYSGSDDPVVKYKAGITVPAEDPQALAEAILNLHAMRVDERRRMGENGRHAALEHYDYAKLAVKLERILVPHT